MSVGTLTQTRDARSRWSVRAFALDRDLVLLVLLTLLAAALRFWRLRYQGFWFDEGNTAQEVHFTPGEMVTLLKHYESTPPFYYAVAWIWARIFGFGEAGLRSLSAVCGVLVVPLGYALAAKLASRRAGLIAAALVATSPLLIWYSQEARAYEMAVLLVGISLLAFLYAEEDASAPALAVWAVAGAFALATEYYSALIVAPEGLWLIYRHRHRRPLQLAIATLAMWSALLLWFAVSQNSTGHASWIKHLPLGPRVGQIFPHFLIGFGAPAGGALSWIAGAVALIALGLLALHTRRAGAGQTRGVALVGGIVLAGVVLNALLLVVRIDNLLTRNVIELWLPMAGFVAAGLALRPRAGLVLAVVLCAVGVAAAVGVAVDRSYQRPDWRGVAGVLGTHPAPAVNQRAFLIQGYRDVLPLSLYMPRLRAWYHTGTDKYSIYMHSYSISELDVLATSSPPASSTGCWWGSACNLVSTPLQRSYPIPGFHLVWIRHSHQFTIMRMMAARPVTVSPQMLSGALTDTQLKYDDLLLQTASP